MSSMSTRMSSAEPSRSGSTTSACAGHGRPAGAGSADSIESVAEQMEGALAALWHDEIEDDGFNALVLDAHLSWRQVVVLRAYAKYLRQIGITFSQDYIERVLAFNVPV